MGSPLRHSDEDTYLTLAEYLAMPEEEGWRVEMSHGRLVREPGPGLPHASVQALLVSALVVHARATGAGRVADNGAFILASEPGTVRIPDIAFIAKERVPRGYSAALPRLAPDLAVEILSPSNRAGDVQERLRDYFDAGVRLIWVIDPHRRTAIAYHPDAPVELVGTDGALDGGNVLPGFRVPLAELFED